MLAAAWLAVLLSLSLDTLVVSVALGARGPSAAVRRRWVAGAVLTEGLMPVLGLFLGRAALALVGPLSSVAGSLIFFLLGWRSLTDADDPLPRVPGGSLLALLAVGLDELGAGTALGTESGFPGILWLLFPLQAALAATAGLALGMRIHPRLQEQTRVLAGALLLVAGVLLLGGALQTL